MNEADTRAKLIDPHLFSRGWTENHIIREHIVQGQRWNIGVHTFADYVLVHNQTSLAVIEAKADYKSARDGVVQAIQYAEKLNIRFAFATNGTEIIKIDLKTKERIAIDTYPTPDELWEWTFSEANHWRDMFNACPWGRIDGQYLPRFYQKNAVNAVLNAIAYDKTRLLLNLATGTGKTAIAFSIAWKLFQTKWTLQKDGKRRPRILFLADRTTLADQAKKDFSTFGDDPMSRINPETLKNNPDKAINANIFFSIFQTFSINSKGQSVKEDDDDTNDTTPFFGTLPEDFFDLIIIDECHRGGAKDESSWRAILEYFSPAVQLGLTATPKRKDNVDTYAYFGEPLYTYSLKDGIKDGYLTPFRVRQIQTSLDEYKYNPQDTVISGEMNAKKLYKRSDWNTSIISEDRERLIVQKLLETLPPNEKTIIFCKTQDHAALIRDLIIDELKPQDNNYCVRVTSNDGTLGETYLGQFRDNEKDIPTILTTSQKLTTGVDARNVRHVVLLREVANIIEFKQIIGRGTRLFDGKDYFTIHDFYGNHKLFSDPEWDGDPIDDIVEEPSKITHTPQNKQPTDDKEPKEPKEKLKIKLSNGSMQEFQTIENTIFYSADGDIISAESFINNLYEIIPTFFNDEAELRYIWSDSDTRKALLQRLAEKGVSLESLISIQKMIQAENSDVFDVLEFFAYNKIPVPKAKRAELVRKGLYTHLTDNQIEFVEFLLESYIDKGHEALEKTNMTTLMGIKYNSFSDGLDKVGDVSVLLTNVQDKIYG